MNYQQELLTEIVEDWNLERLDAYIFHMKERNEQLGDWIRQLQLIKRKKTKNKSTPENGPRDGR